jgi:hypothetical protein
MAHDKGSLGVATGLLMQAFNPRHLFTLLGLLETVDQHDGPAVDPHQTTPEQALERLLPEPVNCSKPNAEQWKKWSRQ